MRFNLCPCSYQRRQWQPTLVLLPGKSHGWRSLVSCSPWDCTESDTTERLHFHFSLSCIREGNGNPFQCSCLENPRNGEAWWAAVYGVAQSRTRLKWLSSSSHSSKPLHLVLTSCHLTPFFPMGFPMRGVTVEFWFCHFLAEWPLTCCLTFLSVDIFSLVT